MEILRYPYRADPGLMLLILGFFGALTAVLGWVLLTGGGAWYAQALFLASLVFTTMGYLGLTRRGEVVLHTDAISAPKSLFRREVVRLARADLTSVELRGRRKDRYLWLRAGEAKLVISERGLPGAEAFDALVAALDPGLGSA
ncbi:hypothetical protein [Aliiroseovarius sp.]|uniref:hypothetical protein n=1 Tax=Aliiroseovarius sp. TaxID=1872442 RepID=UPI003BAB0D48